MYIHARYINMYIHTSVANIKQVEIACIHTSLASTGPYIYKYNIYTCVYTYVYTHTNTHTQTHTDRQT